ncbi:hypothetical protein [Rhodophyticola sp.]|jgi:hypothetical protein|uniref:hypothetical protein n=1 Tax=Rhodophyticola sp. TaxID=2680032 RepID=UPI003D280ABF
MDKIKTVEGANSDLQNLEKQRIKHALVEGGSVSEEGSFYAQSLADGDSGLARLPVSKRPPTDSETAQ